MVLERGALVNNRYRIVEILGQGGMGSVYRAVDENLGVEVAVKDNLFTTEEYARQFRREAIILANLRHPNLPRVTDHFVLEGQGQYLVMDYIEGEDLRQRMDRVGTLPEEEVITIGVAVCEALDFLGTRKPSIVHRDIKPGNIKITPEGQIFLVDFGLAKTIQGSQATTTGARAMTPGYSPPEQYGTARTDQRSDIFSLGATLYAALTGAIPEDALARAMEQTELTPLRKHNPKVSRRLASVLERAISVRPDDRYQTAVEFREALLSARSATRRRPLELVVEPAPEMSQKSIPAEDEVLPIQLVEALARPPSSGSMRGNTPAGGFNSAGSGGNNRAGSATGFGNGGRGGPLLPTSLALDEPEYTPKPASRPRKRKQGRSGGVLWTLVFLALLVGGGFAAYRFQPGLLEPLIARVGPTISSILPASLASALPAVGPTITPNASPATSVPAAETVEPENTPAFTEEPAVIGETPVVPVPTATATLPASTPTTAKVEATATEVVVAPQPTPMGGGGGQIAFASDATKVNQIYIINSDGSGLRQLTDHPDGACQPAWSPDGKQLAFISPCRGNYEYYMGAALFIINADGSGLMPVPTDNDGGDYDPAWSPDGTKILFTSIRNNRRPQLYTYNLADKSVVWLSDRLNMDRMGAWSPDGKKIVFISTRYGTPQIWMMNADGSEPELFSHTRTWIDSVPSFSPDGNLIIFSQTLESGGIPRVMVAEPGAEPYKENRVTTNQLPMREGRYSPDGLWIAFEGWPAGGKHDIYIMGANGGVLQAVTDGKSNCFDPAWNPALP